MGNEKEHRHCWGLVLLLLARLASSSGKAGVPEPGPDTPPPSPPRRAGSSLEREEQLCPGSVPSWLGRHHFLKKEKIHTKKDIQGAKPFPPTHK